MRDQMIRALSQLIGLPLWDATRTLNMGMFQLGAYRTRINLKGEQDTVGEYALHIQCPWRVIGPGGIVVGSEDRHYPADELE